MTENKEGGIMVTALALWLLAATLACLLIVGIAQRAGERANAQAAADAIALAGAAEGEEAAQRLATANGADIERIDQRDGRFTVRVTVSGIAAEASAERQIRPAGRG